MRFSGYSSSYRGIGCPCDPLLHIGGAVAVGSCGGMLSTSSLSSA